MMHHMTSALHSKGHKPRQRLHLAKRFCSCFRRLESTDFMSSRALTCRQRTLNGFSSSLRLA